MFKKSILLLLVISFVLTFSLPVLAAESAALEISSVGIGSVSKSDGAVISWAIKSSGAAECWVEFGVGDFARSTSVIKTGDAENALNIAAVLDGLVSGATYQCRVMAKNAKGTVISKVVRFTVPSDYLPLRLLAEATGYKTTWQGNGKSILLSGYGREIEVKKEEYIIIGSRAYIKSESAASILGSDGSDYLYVYLYEFRPEIYRLSFQIGSDYYAAKKIEKSFVLQIDDDRCSVTVYSDGNNQQPGGEAIRLIEITVRMVKI